MILGPEKMIRRGKQKKHGLDSPEEGWERGRKEKNLFFSAMTIQILRIRCYW